MVFQLFDAGCDENGNRRFLVVVYNATTGKEKIVYRTSEERIVFDLQSEGMVQLKSLPGYNDRIKISEEVYDTMSSVYANNNKLQEHI